MARITVRLPVHIARALKQRAHTSGTSVSRWVRDAIGRETRAKTWPRPLVELLTRGRGDLVEPEDPCVT